MGSSAHEFTLPDRGSGGYGWTDRCLKCSKPFVGGLLGAPVQCKYCKLFACQTCAANRMDWDMGLYGCPAATAATTYAPLEEDFETLTSLRELPPSIQSFQQELIAKHDNLVDCVDIMRNLTTSYHEEVQNVLNTYAVDMAPAASQDAGTGLPSDLADILRERLLPVAEDLMQQSSVALELSAQLRAVHSDGSRRSMDVLAASADVDAAGAYSPVMRTEVSGVPIFMHAGAESEVDATRLLQKICKYRDDEEIEEGLCSRLSTVSRSAMAQVEFLVPALASVLLQAEQEMVFFTREMLRFCILSPHFALKLLWALQAAAVRDPDTSSRLQGAMATCSFESDRDERLARLLWLIHFAVTVGDGSLEERREAEVAVLSLAVAGRIRGGKAPDSRQRRAQEVREALGRRLGLQGAELLCARAALVPVGVRGCGGCTAVLFHTQAELAVEAEPLLISNQLGPGRYQVEVKNLAERAGAHAAAVSFRVERAGREAETLQAELGSRESCHLRLQVERGTGGEGAGKAVVRVQVRWKDLHQMRFSVAVAVLGEPASFALPSARHRMQEPAAGEGTARKEDGTEKGKGKEERMLEEAMRLSLEEHQRLLTREREVMTRKVGRHRAVMQMQMWWEAAVDAARHMTRLRQQHKVSTDNLNAALRRRLRQLELCIPAGTYLPMGGSQSAMEEVIAVHAEESCCLQTPHKVHLLLVVETRVCAHACSRLSLRATMEDAALRDVPFISSDDEPLAEQPCALVKQPAGYWGAERRGDAMAEEAEVVSVGSAAAPSSTGAAGTGEGVGGDVLGERWAEVQARVREASKHAAVLAAAGGQWGCRSVIVKANDDLRQDELAAQLLFLFHTLFQHEGLSLPLRPYAVLATTGLGGGGGGLLETLTDAASIDSLKKKVGAQRGGGAASLLKCFDAVFGERGQRRAEAQEVFVQSMAAYSVFCYVLHVKDRHNGNILLCRDGAVAHVDFGIMLNVRYAKDLVEMKIKLSSEFVQVIGQDWNEFERLCVDGFLAVRKHAPQLLSLLQTSSMAGAAGLPCLEGDAVEQVRRRLVLDKGDGEARQHMMAQVSKARENVRTEFLDLLHDITHANV